MEKKEFAVGEEFQFGLVRLRVEKGESCFGCRFDDPSFDCFFMDSFTGECIGERREDNTDVIFVEVK